LIETIAQEDMLWPLRAREANFVRSRWPDAVIQMLKSEFSNCRGAAKPTDPIPLADERGDKTSPQQGPYSSIFKLAKAATGRSSQHFMNFGKSRNQFS
jgi:hypothetical protein